jgi:aerobic carbon-monoxide dehydrogenase small subunit
MQIRIKEKGSDIQKETVHVALTVNKETHHLHLSSRDTLADVLRYKLGLIGTKLMCDQGECGSCTVLVDDKPMLSCLALAVEFEGMEIVTIDGLNDPVTGDLHTIQKAFVELSGMQCGMCTPGMILTAKALLDDNPSPSEDDVREALAGNLCRCGNYKRITECVLAAADMMKGPCK